MRNHEALDYRKSGFAIVDGKLIVAYKTGEKNDCRFVFMVVDQENQAFFKSALLSQGRRKVLKFFGLAGGIGCLLFFCLVWQSNMLDDYSPTGLWKELSNPSSVWFYFFIDIMFFLLITITSVVLFWSVTKKAI